RNKLPALLPRSLKTLKRAVARHQQAWVIRSFQKSPHWLRPPATMIVFGSTEPSSAASNTTQGRSTKLNSPSKSKTKKAALFGSVGGGGRYAGLLSRFGGEPVPATGFSIGVSRLQAALAALGKIDETPGRGPVLVTVFDRDRIADYQRMVSALRTANIRAELYLGNPKNNIGAQLKYADKRGSPCAVIQGGDEKTRGEVQIKDLILGAGLADIKDREEYLKKQAEAQFAVNEEALVGAVRKLLTRHKLA